MWLIMSVYNSQHWRLKMPTSLIKMNVVNVCFYHLGYHLDCKSKKLQVFRIVLSFVLLLRQSRSVLGNNKNISLGIIACLRLKKKYRLSDDQKWDSSWFWPRAGWYTCKALMLLIDTHYRGSKHLTQSDRSHTPQHFKPILLWWVTGVK